MIYNILIYNKNKHNNIKIILIYKIFCLYHVIQAKLLCITIIYNLLYNPSHNTGFISLSNNTHGWSLVKDKIPNKIKKWMIGGYENKILFE